MRGKIPLSIASVMAVILILSSNTRGQNIWQVPFDTVATNNTATDSFLSLNDVFELVASSNPAFSSFSYQLQAAKGDLKQSGLWSNPELSAEIEDVGWDAPGFRESEFTVSLSQDFEFFGKRDAKKRVARAGVKATALRVKLATFDLYLDAKQRFYNLAYAQQEVQLKTASLNLVSEIVESINYRLSKGAALQSELLLAQLEEQRAKLALEQAKQDVMAYEASLVALWHGKPSGVQVLTNTEPDFSRLLQQVSSITNTLDSSRELSQLYSESEMFQAEKRLATTETRPVITLSGGYKRIEIDKSNTILFGVSLPLPLLNKNQGKRESLEAKLSALEYDIQRAKNETEASVRSQTIRLHQLISKHATLDSLLLPTAEQAYRTLQSAYESGRVPYTQLLEAERFHNELSFEHNDMLFAIYEQIIALEHLTGVALRIDEEM